MYRNKVNCWRKKKLIETFYIIYTIELHPVSPKFSLVYSYSISIILIIMNLSRRQTSIGMKFQRCKLKPIGVLKFLKNMGEGCITQ